MSTKKILKQANSKGQLAKAIVLYQRTLTYYANENNWAVRGDDIVWLGDDDPTYAASLTLGKRKHDPDYYERNKSRHVREPDKSQPTSTPTKESTDVTDAR